MRYRKGYGAGDIRRIQVQQDFIKAAISQIIKKLSWTDILTLADIFINDVTTDMSLDALIYFADKAMKLDMNKVNFMTMPGNYSEAFKVNGKWVSYVSCYVDQWLEMRNAHLNPTTKKITRSNVQILYRKSDRTIGITSGKSVVSSSWGQ